MIRGRGQSGGYTIVETLIFLAVTGMLFTSAMLFVSGQRQKTEFSQGVRDFASELQTIAMNVSTGYTAFPFSSGDHCWTDGNTITVGPTDPIGSYELCVFVGRAVQFAPAGDTKAYKIYSVVGKQYDAGREATSLANTKALAMSAGTSYNTSGTEYAAETKTFEGGLTVAWVRYGSTTATATTNTSGLGFFTTFARYSGTSVDSSSIYVNALPLAGAFAFADTNAQFVNKLDAFMQSGTADSTAVTNNKVVRVCLNSGGTNQRAEITLGNSTSGSLQVTTDILAGLCI